MASTPTTIWTALPNGFDASFPGNAPAPKLSIYVSLRLDDPTGTTLGDYTLGNWPTALAALVNQNKIRVQVGDGTTFSELPLAINTSQLSPSLWDALFASTTLVSPFAFQDHSKRAIRSYSVRAIHDYIEQVYTSVANSSPTDFPDLKGTGPAAHLVQAVSSVMTQVRRAATGAQVRGYNPPLPPNLASGVAGPHPDAKLEAQLDTTAKSVAAGIPGAELYRAYRFYNRGQQEQYRSNTQPRAVADIPPALHAPKFDFHQVIATLGDHPALLRQLGIVVDCTLPQSWPAGSTYDRVRIVVGDPAGGPPSPTDKTPWTLVDLVTFRAQPSAAADTSGGYLQLGNSQLFGVTQSDVDGAALRTLDYGVNMANVLSQLAQQHAAQCDVAGLAAPPKSQPQPQSLPALRTTGISVFRSDRDRAIFDQLSAAASNNVDPGSAVLSEADLTRGYRVDVGLGSRWFSLCARIPTYAVGATMIAPGQDEGYVKASSGTSTSKDPPSPPAVKDLYLHETLFGWDNWSLSVERPGRTLSIDRNDTDRTQTEVVRREQNPANPDFPVQISASVPAKALPPLRFGRQYQLRARVVDLAGNGLLLSDMPAAAIATVANTSPLTYQRYEPVAPPVLVLHTPLTPGESVEHLVIRSKVGSAPIPNESSIFNATTLRHVSPPKTSQYMAELHGAFDALFPDAAKVYAVAVKEQGTWQDPGGDTQLLDMSGKTVDPAPLDQRGEPLPDGHYVIHTSKSPAVPYLPDPLAAGALLQIPGGFMSHDYAVGSGWPNLSTFQLTLDAASGASPKFDKTGGLHVALPKGTMLTLKYSSTIAEPNLPLMARWNTLSAAARGSAKAIGNQHWMLTPYREVLFVHAVEKPLRPPQVTKLSVSRNLGENFVTLSGEITNHSQSTGRIELLAAWTETVDRLSETKPTLDTRSGRVFERDIAYDESPMKIPAPCETARHELGDTKHRMIKYHALATTRYREHFPELANKPELLSLAGAATAEIDIPNAARPDSPRLQYIIPTFEWTLSDDKKTSTRTGRGLRIYVDRTWYSSGDDELLGVLLPQAGLSVPDALEKYVSQWGSDPIWDSKGPSSQLAPESFVYDKADPSSAPTVKSGLTLAEVDPSRSDLLVTAVGIAPQYNEERQLYYFDLVLDPGASYFPFVRLSLARFQPHSLDNAHLSRTVRADFAQLVADRTAALTYNTGSVDVSVSGVMAKSVVQAMTHETQGPLHGFLLHGFNHNAAAGRGRLVRAYVEQRTDKKLGDLGWQLVGGVSNLLPYVLGKTPDLVYFRGNVTLPQSFGDSSEYRMVVEEHELFDTDLQLIDSSLPIDSTDGEAHSSRLVYFDTLTLVK